MTSDQHILVVDDDSGLRALLGSFLQDHGYRVTLAEDGATLRQQLAAQSFDLIVMDVMMPGEDGLTILRSLRPAAHPPVILMSVIGSEVDRIVGLEMGADDYVPKPFNPRELLARIRAVLRRSEARPGATAVAPRPLFSFMNCKLDPLAREMIGPDGEKIGLTDGEFRLLLALVEHPRHILSRDQLLDLSRGHDAESYDRAIDIQISRLRKKLPGNLAETAIRTVRNEGYVFDLEVERQ